MTIFEISNRFSTEESCIEDFKKKREESGLCCLKCKNKNLYWLSAKKQWQCSKCSYRIGIKKGTFMEYSKLSILDWYRAMILISFSKKGLSSLEIKRQLGKNRYESTWAMVHKIRKSMGKINNGEKLKGHIEFDEGYFSVSTPKKTKSKRGRRSRKKAKVAVMVESTPLEDPITGKVRYWIGRFKMNILESHHKEKVNELLEEKLTREAVVISDKSTSYVDIRRYFEHYSTLSEEHIVNESLKWVHMAIGNAKRKLLGINHCIKREYLQNYLDEFCFKLNRRMSNLTLFEDLTRAVSVNYL